MPLPPRCCRAPAQIVTELRNRHARGEVHAGINVRRGEVSDMLAENVVQPLLVTSSALTLATECVRMILKVPSLQRLIPHHPTQYCDTDKATWTISAPLSFVLSKQNIE